MSQFTVFEIPFCLPVVTASPKSKCSHFETLPSEKATLL